VNAPYLSIVTSLYRSESTAGDFIRRASAAAEKISPDYEIILVNDGSPDKTRDVVVDCIKDNPRVTLLDLSRNFGQLPAIHAGLTHARGQYIFVLDSDLEEPPELVETFHTRLKANPDIDVVYAIQKERRDPFFRAMTSQLFYWFFERMTGIRNLKNMLILRIMSRRFLDAYLSIGDYHLFVAGLTHQAGFDKETITVEKEYKGHSSYSFKKRLMMAGNAILSFSTQPLYGIFVGSLLAALLMVLMAAGLVVTRILHPDYQAGWASLVISIWLVGAIITNCMAVIGLYIAKIFEQVKERPRFIVRQIYTSGQRSP
jgi:putative glycosyltransferase